MHSGTRGPERIAHSPLPGRRGGSWAGPGSSGQSSPCHESCRVRTGPRDMAAPGPALCLFDVDGTLTAPRQVGGARRAGGSRCGACSCSLTRRRPRWVGVEHPCLLWWGWTLFWVPGWIRRKPQPAFQDLSVHGETGRGRRTGEQETCSGLENPVLDSRPKP